MRAQERPSTSASAEPTAPRILEESSVRVSILEDNSQHSPPSPSGGLRLWRSGDEVAVAAFWEEDRRPGYYITCCCVLGMTYVILILLTILRSPYGNINVRPQPENTGCLLAALPAQSSVGCQSSNDHTSHHHLTARVA
ncbi:hypothetical protein T484DRAFT_1752117 [Baffinella frigidus]|nr:hypothetical protein T484DRAFT_1752117 [Cryptophyta sp. CCMP2293]